MPVLLFVQFQVLSNAYIILLIFNLGMILKAIEKFICKEKLRAEYYGLIWFCFFTALLCAILSFQMCIIGSEFNATFLVIEFSFLR